MSVLLWNVLFLLLLCFRHSSMGVDQSIHFPEKFYYWKHERLFPPRTCLLKAIGKSFHSACEWCRTGFPYGGALRRLRNGTCSLRDAGQRCWKPTCRRSPHLPACPAPARCGLAGLPHASSLRGDSSAGGRLRAAYLPAPGKSSPSKTCGFFILSHFGDLFTQGKQVRAGKRIIPHGSRLSTVHASAFG